MTAYQIYARMEEHVAYPDEEEFVADVALDLKEVFAKVSQKFVFAPLLVTFEPCVSSFGGIKNIHLSFHTL